MKADRKSEIKKKTAATYRDSQAKDQLINCSVSSYSKRNQACCRESDEGVENRSEKGRGRILRQEEKNDEIIIIF